MCPKLGRREFLSAAVAGGAVCFRVFPASYLFAAQASPAAPRGLISPGCRRSRVRVGRVYLGGPHGLWPTPTLDLRHEVQRYEAEFARLKNELADVDFVGNRLITSVDEAKKAKEALQDVDGILAIHLSMGIGKMLPEILAIGRPTILFALPYAGHEWTNFGHIRKTEEGQLLDCMLTTDFTQLAAAVRPFRAMHHLREAKIINVTKRSPADAFVTSVREKLGTQIKTIGREPILAAYDAVPEADAAAEADRWMQNAEKVVEPSRDEIVRSCRLALAFENVLADEDATVMTVDCYGSMYHKLPAFPCVGFTRLNDRGLGGICESDLACALTYVLFQGLTGRPGFISDPTIDEASDSIILAHCLGTTKMDGPDGEAARYRLRTIMERQEGAVPQVFMRVGQAVTQAKLIGTDQLVYFTGKITDAPDLPRGCRTKIAVRVNGDIKTLWQNWSHGLHRVTCYGDLTDDLERFCRFTKTELVDEAGPASQA
jgi:hypothetical protein